METIKDILERRKKDYWTLQRILKEMYIQFIYAYREAKGLTPFPSIREIQGNRYPIRCTFCGLVEMPFEIFPTIFNEKTGFAYICTHHQAFLGQKHIDCLTAVTIEMDNLTESPWYFAVLLRKELKYWSIILLNTIKNFVVAVYRFVWFLLKVRFGKR